jgi:alpha-amylase/alpha-mannosidase (GH57 family)
MTSSVSLLFGVHAHQPAGNFRSVVDEAHEKSYGPFLRTVYRYPAFRFSAHFSGWLLDHLLTHYPGDMNLLREMVERGQAELFGGGDMEPVLAAIPHRDRVGQLCALSNRLTAAFGSRPTGAWLTERVWEATVVPALADAGLEFVTVDDYHFFCAGLEANELTGYFTTEEDNRRLDLFPISEQLRYRIPFAPAADTVRYLESLAVENQTVASIYFDDIEKFGIWPETHDWVYGKRWLEQFIEGVLSSASVTTSHFGEFRSRHATHGVVYLPTTSYMEMGEWTLPSDRADDFAELIAQHRANGQYDRFKPFLRGGIWRNFLSRYPEANWMHKRMLALSERLHRAPAGTVTSSMINSLYRAQANDGYWHGLFGGIYLPHLRRAVWRSMLDLEHDLDTAVPRFATETLDIDLDGRQETFVRNADVQIVIREDSDAAIVELSSYALRHNFGDTLMRRREHYYRHVARQDETTKIVEGIASAHDRVAFRHEIHAEDLREDARPRASFVDTLTAGMDGGAPSPAYERAGGTDTELGFLATLPGSTVSKTYRLQGRALSVTYLTELDSAGELQTEINLAMPSCDGFLGRLSRDGGVTGGFGSRVDHGSTSELLLEDGVLEGALLIRIQPPACAISGPLHTVSQSEAGFEKIMQALTLNLAWVLPKGHHEIRVTLDFWRDGAVPQTT